MKFSKIISITLIIIMLLYIVLSSFEGIGNVSYAAGLTSIEEAEKLAPGITGLVNNLRKAHPNYNFQFYNTGIDWNEAILREYQGHGASPKNLFNVSDKYSGMWYCPVCGTKSYDNGSLCCASMDALRYMMDPRNSITEDSVFQFKSLETPDVTYEDVVRVIAGTFLDHEECARAVVEASQKYNINGYYLVAKMLTEHGKNGSTLSKGVVVNGVTYYNFFNIGAYGNDVNTIIANGGNYAAQHGWNSKAASIIGGAEFAKSSYVGKGQNTCYYQKFNVVNAQSGLFSHQYAQNILAAENEGSKLRANYIINGQVTGNHTFIIPLYTNMPQTAQGRPSTATQNRISYETAVVTANGGLKVRSRQDINSAHIGSIPQNTGVKVLIRAANQNNGYYWDLVIADSTGLCGYVARNYIRKTGEGSNAGSASSSEYVPSNPSQTPTTPTMPTKPTSPTTPTQVDGTTLKIENNIVKVSAKMTITDLKTKYPNAEVKDGANGKLGTCSKVNIDGKDYDVIKKGDVNGDGDVNILDSVAIINHIKETAKINNVAKLDAAQVKGEGSITITDVVALLNYIKGSTSDLKIK